MKFFLTKYIATSFLLGAMFTAHASAQSVTTGLGTDAVAPETRIQLRRLRILRPEFIRGWLTDGKGVPASWEGIRSWQVVARPAKMVLVIYTRPPSVALAEDPAWRAKMCARAAVKVPGLYAIEPLNEVWFGNYPDITWGDADALAKRLIQVYSACHDALRNTGVKLIGPTIGSTVNIYNMQVFKAAGGLKYLDAVSFHQGLSNTNDFAAQLDQIVFLKSYTTLPLINSELGIVDSNGLTQTQITAYIRGWRVHGITVIGHALTTGSTADPNPLFHYWFDDNGPDRYKPTPKLAGLLEAFR